MACGVNDPVYGIGNPKITVSGFHIGTNEITVRVCHECEKKIIPQLEDQFCSFLKNRFGAWKEVEFKCRS
jgi:hypothetical protein